MNNKRFTSLIKSKYPSAEVSAHGNYGGLSTQQSVAVIFETGRKTYDYRGSYTQILESLGIMREWVVIRNDEKYGEAFYTQVEAQKYADKRNTEHAKMVEIADENGYYVGMREQVFTVKNANS